MNAPVTKASVDHYPNPVRNLLNITMTNEGRGNVTVRVLGVDGKLQLQRLFNKDQESLTASLPVQQLKTGIYFVEVQVGDSIKETMKIIKQ